MSWTHELFVDDDYHRPSNSANKATLLPEGALQLTITEPTSFSLAKDGVISGNCDGLYLGRAGVSLLCLRYLEPNAPEFVMLARDASCDIHAYRAILEEAYCWCRAGRRAEAYREIVTAMDMADYDIRAMPAFLRDPNMMIVSGRGIMAMMAGMSMYLKARKARS